MKIISKALMRLVRIIDECGRRTKIPALREEFKNLPFSGQAIQKLLDQYEFDTVLDIGSGEGLHADTFIRHGKKVTEVDYGRSVYFEKRKEEKNLETIVADFNKSTFDRQFECVWCSHILEHQLNPHTFLQKIHGLIKEGGVLAVTVPPLRTQIIGGHVCFWNAGLLLYRLVLAGFDCRSVRVLKYGYNISVILKKRTVDVSQRIVYDSGDIRKIREFLPDQLRFYPCDTDDPFDGDILELNWGS